MVIHFSAPIKIVSCKHNYYSSSEVSHRDQQIQPRRLRLSWFDVMQGVDRNSEAIMEILPTCSRYVYICTSFDDDPNLYRVVSGWLTLYVYYVNVS